MSASNMHMPGRLAASGRRAWAAGRGPGQHLGGMVPARHRQRGAMMLEVGLALVISAIAAAGALRETMRVARMDMANIQADALQAYSTALDRYVNENYTQLQNLQPVTVNGVTLAAGTTAGQTLRPTVANLLAMGYLPAGFQDSAIAVDGGSYDNQIDRLPVGCVASACRVSGFAYINRPVVVRGTTDEDGLVLGQMMARIGGHAAVSSSVNPNTLFGAGGTFTRANPLAGNPAGVIGVRFADGASDMSQFLRVADARDPNFQGPFTVAGNATLNGTLAVAGNTTLSGDVSVRNGATDCVQIQRTGVVNITCSGQINATGGGAIGGVTLAGGSVMADTGIFNSGVVARNMWIGTPAFPNAIQSAGSNIEIRAGGGLATFGINGSLTMTGTSAFLSAGSYVQGTRMSIRTAVTEGASCSRVGAADVGALADGSVAMCVGGVWRAVQRVGTLNGACTSSGATAIDQATGVGMTCRAGYWMNSNELSSRFVLMHTASVSDGSNVSKPGYGGIPACQGPSGVATPLIILTPLSDSPTYTSTGQLAGTDRYAQDMGTYWTTFIRSSAGTSVAGASAIAHVYCYYSF